MVEKLGTREFFEWLKYKFSGHEEDDPDLRMIECSLIRTMSEYREIKLAEIHYSKDFDERFLQNLAKEETNFATSDKLDNYDYSPKKWTVKILRYSFVGLILVGVTAFVAFWGMSDSTSSASSQTAASLKLDPDVINELREEFQLIKKIRSSNDIEALKVLETYNLTNGITDRATRIHYTIELLSK